MKFRAVMIDSLPMREFHNIVTSISKLCKDCVIRLSQRKIYFIVSEESFGPQPPVIWCELDQSSFFSEYHMEGVDETHRDIYFSILTASIAHSLMPLKRNTKSVKMKLTKKDRPCLTLEIEAFSTDMINVRQITHDIPITVIPRKSWGDFDPPLTQNYHISIEMPSFRQLKIVVDKMKNLSQYVILKACSSGQMILQIKTDLVTVSSKFQNLTVDNFRDKEPDLDDEEGDDELVVCKVDIKQFSNFLTANQTNCTRFTCSMVHRKLIMLFFEKEDIMMFQCFIPAVVV